MSKTRLARLHRPLVGNRASDGWWLIGGAAFGLLSSWLSAPWHASASRFAWLLDLVTHGQWLYLILLVLGVALLIRRYPAAVLALLLLPLPWLSASPSLVDQTECRDSGTDSGLHVAVANLNMASPPLPALTAWLDDRRADLLILLECTPAMAHWLDNRRDLPHHAGQPDDSPFGLCLRAAWPLLDARTEWDAAGIPRLHAELDWAGRRVRVIALHPMPPLSVYFHQLRNQQLHHLMSDLDPTQPAILAGDLNASPWSSAFAGLARTGVRRASGLQPTWPAVGQGWFGIPIDQVLVTTAWCGVERAPTRSLGSDHRALSVRLW
ncbi:endonuclease/exonuclease/phosphatase family protein [Rhabdochromatium marinum]|uniref:endonuclease/exonuclease/phosphatase family protein n=1 Tax=Rhabdochromatium marinum TaxID=48729 RepID=UPI0019035B9B|nr:endonuclease/exonuclease/phosphatase family protein [Rhabdochromatium marinum]